MTLRQAWLPVALGGLTNGLIADDAAAHVKWFCAFDVAGQPRNLENVLCPNFELLAGAAILVLLVGCQVERTRLGEGMQRALDRVFSDLQFKTELMFRAGCGFFFVSIWAVGGILLTPELKTDSTAIGYLQLAIAAGMLSRQTMPLSGLGIAVLFAVAIVKYGVFHLADYPVFLGAGAYVAPRRRTAGPIWRAADGYSALGRGHHFDVGIRREMGLSRVELSALCRQPVHDARLRSRILHAGGRGNRVYPRLCTNLDSAGPSHGGDPAVGHIHRSDPPVRHDRRHRPHIDHCCAAGDRRRHRSNEAIQTHTDARGLRDRAGRLPDRLLRVPRGDLRHRHHLIQGGLPPPTL